MLSAKSRCSLPSTRVSFSSVLKSSRSFSFQVSIGRSMPRHSANISSIAMFQVLSTFFRAVRKLQPGHYAVWQDGNLTNTRYFTPPFATTVPDVTSFEDAVRMFETTFDEAVRIRMRSDAPFGAYLSGGVDSSAVVATMVRHSSEPVRTFSVGFRETEYSELDHARVVAEQFGTNHHELVVEPGAFMDHWPTAVLRRGAPVSEASDIPIFMLSKLASGSVKMVLTGEGSDELMGGYPKHRAEQWVNLYQRLMPKFLHEQLIHPLVQSLPYSMRRVKILALAAGERDLVNRMRIWFGGVSVKEREAILGRATSADAAGSLSILIAAPIESAANLVLRSNLLASRQSVGAGRSYDDGRVNRRQDAIHGYGVGECRGALPGQISHRSQGRQGCVARKHGERLPAKNSAPEKGRISGAIWSVAEGTLSRFCARHARKRQFTYRAHLQSCQTQEPSYGAYRRATKSRTCALVSDQPRNLPARVQTIAAPRARRGVCAPESRLIVTIDGLSRAPSKRIWSAGTRTPNDGDTQPRLELASPRMISLPSADRRSRVEQWTPTDWQ